MVKFFCLVLKLLNRFSLDVPVSQIYNHNLSFSHFCFALVPRAGKSSFVQSSFYLMYLWYLLHPIKTYIRVFLDFVMIIFQLPSWPDLDSAIEGSVIHIFYVLSSLRKLDGNKKTEAVTSNVAVVYFFFLGQDRTLFLSKRFCLWLWILSTKKIEERKREKNW